MKRLAPVWHVEPVVLPGQEQFEEFVTCQNELRVSYRYAHPTNGRIFTCFDVDLETCRQRRDAWLAECSEDVERARLDFAVRITDYRLERRS